MIELHLWARNEERIFVNPSYIVQMFKFHPAYSNDIPTELHLINGDWFFATESIDEILKLCYPEITTEVKNVPL